MVNGFEEEVKALEEYGHDCCARIDDRIHECCKRIREAHEQELDNTRYAYEISMSLMKEQPSPVTYDVLDNERHKAVCELRKLPDGYPSYSAFPFVKWYEDLSTALGICKGEVSCAKVRDTLIHLLGGDQMPVALGDPYGISKEGDGGVDAGRRVETGDGRSDAAAAGRDSDCAGNPLAEGVAPITTELRAACGSANDMVSYVAIDSHDFDRLCDAIDAVHAQLERDYKVACEVNERQDEQYADMVHKLDRAYEKNRNQRRQLTEVQEALHKRNEGELKTRWQKELDRLERENEELRHENEELRRQLESLMLDSGPVDADGVPIRLGDEVYQVEGGWVYTVKSITFYPDNTTVSFECEHGFGCDSAHNLRHYHAPTVEGVLRDFAQEMNENLGMYTGEAVDADEWRDADAKTVEKFAAKLRLAGDAE